MVHLHTLIALSLVVYVSDVHAQQPKPNGLIGVPYTAISDPQPIPDELQLPPLDPDASEPLDTTATDALGSSADDRLHLKIRGNPCPPESQEFRMIDGSCNNERNIRWGATNRGQLVSWPCPGSDPVGQDRPSPRHISNIVCNQEDNDIPNERRMSEFVTYFGQFLDHNVVATPGGAENMDIPVPPDDEIFHQINGNGSKFIGFSRSQPVTLYGRRTALNLLSSYIDLSAVYGNDVGRANALRTFQNGKLKVSSGNLMPKNDLGLANAPSSSKEYYIAGDFRANEHPGLATIHTIWLREHNKICDTLKAAFPRWGDERLYQMARKINGANFQRIVYEEFYPSVTGRGVGRYYGYNENTDATISILFTTAAYRLGHSMVGPDVKRRGSGNVPLPPLTFGDVFFSAPHVLKEKNIEEFVRGMVGSMAQEVDTKAVRLVRNFLFTRVEEVSGFDLISFNLQRGRDHRLPSYNDIRMLVGRSPAESYRDFASSEDLAIALEEAYGPNNVDAVDAWIGLLSEPHIPRGSVGLTTYLIWRRQFRRLMHGDRFFYKRQKQFSRRVAAAMRSHGGVRMRDIILRNTNVSPSELTQNVWFVPGNEAPYASNLFEYKAKSYRQW